MIDPVRMMAIASTRSASRTPSKLARPPVEAIHVDKPTLPRLLALADELARSGPPIDYARIAQIRRAIADGRYPIDMSALAKAIVRFDPDL